MRLIAPLTMRELIADPIYRPYMLRAPRLPAGCQGAEPWRVWGLRDDDKWAGKLFPDFRSGFDLVKKMIKDERYVDVAIICRPKAFPAPAGFVIPPTMDWCGHCRRPTVYRRSLNHHAMRKWPVVSDEDVRRCYYCASRESASRWVR